MIAFGPLLTRVSESEALADTDLVHTGVVIEIGTPERAIVIPVYRDTKHWRADKPSFSDYYIASSDLPFEITLWGFQQKETSFGILVGLSAYICALYKEVQVLRPLADFLADFQALQPFDVRSSKPDAEQTTVLSKELSSGGYIAGNIWGYGRRHWVEICWYSPEKVELPGRAFSLHCGRFEFRPTAEKKLDAGKWREPNPHTVEELLWNRLRTISGQTPLQSLSEEGINIVLSKFEWSQLTLMTAKQARSARLDFLRSHPELRAKTSELAHALRSAGLYSSDTSITQIVRAVPKLLTQVQSQP
jgi:hypothetical protein